MRGLKGLASDDDCCGYWPFVQVEEFAHINGWEACPDEEPSTEKPSSKTSSRVSTPVTEIVDSKKVEQEPVKKEEKEATPEKKEEEQQKSEPMETDKDEGGTAQLTDRLFSRRGGGYSLLWPIWEGSTRKGFLFLVSGIAEPL